MPQQVFDLALAGRNGTAYTLAQLAVSAGLSVLVLDLPAEAPQVTVSWVVKQKPALLEEALTARAFYLQLCDELDVPLLSKGALLLAFQEEEMTVLEEFAGKASLLGYILQLLTPQETLRAHAAVSPVGLEGALLSPTEISFSNPLLLRQWRKKLSRQGVAFRSLPEALAGEAGLSVLLEHMPAQRRFLCDARLARAVLPSRLPPAQAGAALSSAEGRVHARVAGKYLLNAGWVENPVPSFELCESLPQLRPRLLKGCGCEAVLLPDPSDGYYLCLSTIQHRTAESFGRTCRHKVQRRLGVREASLRKLQSPYLPPGLHHFSASGDAEVFVAEGDIHAARVLARARAVLSGARP